MARPTYIALLIAVLVLGVVSSFLLRGGSTDRSLVNEDVASDVTAPGEGSGSTTPAPDKAAPTSILRVVVPRLSIDAPTVVLGVDSAGVMQSPSTPVDVGWYNFSALPNQGGNIVLSGHVDYVNYGPAVFWRLRELRTDDVVQLLLADQTVATYRVESVKDYEAAAAPVQEIVGKTSGEAVTFITCAGGFNARTREYDRRLVVRAFRT